jgi:hypothetical protein
MQVHLGDLIEHTWICTYAALEAVALVESIGSRNR